MIATALTVFSKKIKKITTNTFSLLDRILKSFVENYFSRILLLGNMVHQIQRSRLLFYSLESVVSSEQQQEQTACNQKSEKTKNMNCFLQSNSKWYWPILCMLVLNIRTIIKVNFWVQCLNKIQKRQFLVTRQE